MYSGWIKPFKNDLSDIQWRQYRASLPKLMLGLSLYTLASRALQKRPSDATACCFSPLQHTFRVAASILFLFVLHGAYAVHVITALCGHYLITTATAGQATIGPIAIWGFPAAVWFAGRLADGVPWSTIAPPLGFLDAYGGPVRWHIGFNLLLLRMVSWGLDMHWTRLWQKGLHTPSGALSPSPRGLHTATLATIATPQRTHACTPPLGMALLRPPCHACRSQRADEGVHGRAAQLQHPDGARPAARAPRRRLVLAADAHRVLPLPAAVPHRPHHHLQRLCVPAAAAEPHHGGPPLPRHPRPLRPQHHKGQHLDTPDPRGRLQGRALLLFAGRIALALLLLEALTHTLYVNALTRFRAWDRVPAAAGAALFDGRAMAALAFYKLIFLWLKFLVVWRVARLFALADGVDPPENMLRNAPAHPCSPAVCAVKPSWDVLGQLHFGLCQLCLGSHAEGEDHPNTPSPRPSETHTAVTCAVVPRAAGPNP